jgi:Icc-related predicted phosphoesterase
MRLLVFSDVHSDLNAARRLVERAGEADVVVGAGDFCQMRRNLDATIDVLRQIEVPTVLAPGNAESAKELRAACAGWSSAHVLHGDGATIGGVSFFGIGGGIPVTPFGDWSCDFTEAEAEAMLSACPDEGVLVSHSPPHGVVDQDSSGEHLGSTAVRDAVQSRSLQLVVCGHIHGSWEETGTIGDTTVVNAGPKGLVREVEG